MLKTSRRKAFTLVEIMVVVTLIGLLAVSAVPAYQRIKLRAVSATLVAEMRTLEEAFQRYAQETGEFPRTAAVIVIAGPTISLNELKLIDEWIDDGDTDEGTYVVSGAGVQVFYILEGGS